MYRLPQEQPHDEKLIFRQPPNWRAIIPVVMGVATSFVVSPLLFCAFLQASTLRCDAGGGCVLEGTETVTFRREQLADVSLESTGGKGCHEFVMLNVRDRPSIKMKPYLACADAAAVRASITAYIDGHSPTLLAESPHNLVGAGCAALMFAITCFAAAFAFKTRGDRASVQTAFIVSWLRRELLVQKGTGSQRYTFDEIGEIRVAFKTDGKNPKVIVAYGLALQTPDARGFSLTPLRPGGDNAFEGAAALRRALRMRPVDDRLAVLGAVGSRMSWGEYFGRAALGAGLLMGGLGAIVGVIATVQVLLYPQTAAMFSASTLCLQAAAMFTIMAPTALIMSAVLSKKVAPWRGP